MCIINTSSNNTNKLSPQEQRFSTYFKRYSSNNTNKLSPQELVLILADNTQVQIIQINLALKNSILNCSVVAFVQIIQINLALKNAQFPHPKSGQVQIIQINLALKNYIIYT